MAVAPPGQSPDGNRAAPKDGVVIASIRSAPLAEIVAEAYGGLEIEIVPALRPDQQPEALVRWLGERRATGPVTVVGHEPHLSTLVGWLLSGAARSLLDLKKGAACLVSCDRSWGPGAALLRWSLTANQLRALRGDAAASRPTAAICWMNRKPMRIGEKYRLHHATRLTRCMVTHVDCRIDVNTLAQEPDVPELHINDVAVVRVKTLNPIAADTYEANRTTGAFILIDEDNNTVAGGMIRGTWLSVGL